MTWKEVKARHWFFSPQLESWQRKILSNMRRRVPADKKTLWVLSSGTQSVNTVKAIGLTIDSVLCAAEAANHHLGSLASDRWMVAIPGYHIGGLSIYARAFLTRAKVFEFKGRWNAVKYSTALDKNKITLTSLVPTQIHDLVEAGMRAPTALRAAIVGGGALDSDLYLRARELGWPVLPSYGLTECSSQVATASLDSLQSSQVPKLTVLPHVTVDLREQRIYLKSEALCRFVAVGNTQGVFTLEDPKRSGWFQTEDLADGNPRELKILGRRDDVVKILGSLVSIGDVEKCAREYFFKNGLSGRLCVVPLRNERDGSSLILLTDSASSFREWERRLHKFNSTVSGPQRIKNLCWVPEIPHGDMGKIKKSLLVNNLFTNYSG